MFSFRFEKKEKEEEKIFFVRMSTFIVCFVFIGWIFGRVDSAVGEKKRTFTSRAEGTIVGNYLFLSRTTFTSRTPPFEISTTFDEFECKCRCSKHRQCLAVTFRLTDRMCSFFGNDPCENSLWRNEIETNFYVNIKRLKYRLYEKPEKNQRLKRLTISNLCASMSQFDSERRWLFVMKISGKSTKNFNGLTFDEAPNRVAPSPWTTNSIETIWNSILMSQWTSHVYFPKYFGFALIFNETVREFVYFRLHKTTVTNFFNKQHTPNSFCWNFKGQRTHFHQILEERRIDLKRMFSISINGSQISSTPCENHQSFMFISPVGQSDRCLNRGNPTSTIRIVFSDRCQPSTYENLLRADALIGLTSGETTTDV